MLMRPYDPRCDAHPDPFIEGLLTVLRRTSHELARLGASEAARASFDQAIRVGDSWHAQTKHALANTQTTTRGRPRRGGAP